MAAACSPDGVFPLLFPDGTPVATHLDFQSIWPKSHEIWTKSAKITKSQHVEIWGCQFLFWFRMVTSNAASGYVAKISTMSNVQCPTYNVQRTMSNVRCPTYDVQRTMSNVRCPTYDVHRTMSTVRCPPYDVQHTMSNVQSGWVPDGPNPDGVRMGRNAGWAGWGIPDGSRMASNCPAEASAYMHPLSCARS